MAQNNPKTILVVDDDQDLLTLVSMILEAEGYTVNSATDGREGLRAVEKTMPDLILLDMKMPVMNGWEFAKEFHARFSTGTPVVVLTAAADAKKYAREIGAVGYIGKPFDLDSLLRTVDKYIRY